MGAKLKLAILDFVRRLFRKPPKAAPKAAPRRRGPSELELQRRDTRETAVAEQAFASFGEALSDLDDKLERLRSTRFSKPIRKRGQKWLETDLVMKKVGVYIPYGHEDSWLEAGDHVNPFIRDELPGMFACSLPSRFFSDEQREELGEDFLDESWIVIHRISRRSIFGVAFPTPKSVTPYSVVHGVPHTSKRKPSIFVEVGFIGVRPDGSFFEIPYKNTGERHFHKCDLWGTHTIDGQTCLEYRFSLLVNMALRRDMHWQVHAYKEGYRIVFTIPDNDAPNFFRDRESKGKRIYHAVRAHERKNGQLVRTHYRGARHFQHDGWDIEIALPGKDLKPLTDFKAVAG